MRTAPSEEVEMESDSRLRDPYESNAHLVGAKATAIVWLLILQLLVTVTGLWLVLERLNQILTLDNLR